MNRHYVNLKSWDNESGICAIVYLEPGETLPDWLDETLHIVDNGPGFPGGRFVLTIENMGWQSDSVAELESHLRDWAQSAERVSGDWPGELRESDWTLDSFIREYCAARGFDLDSDIAAKEDMGGVFAHYFSDATRESWPVSDAIETVDSALSQWWPGNRE